MPRGACDSCRILKIRCNQEQPVCQQCSGNQRQCQYLFSNTIKRSCLSCRSKKKKCDGKKPACSSCVTSKKPCSYQKDKEEIGFFSKTDLVATRKNYQTFNTSHSSLNIPIRKGNFIEYDYSTHHLFYLGGSRINVVPSVFMRDLFIADHVGKTLLVDGRSLNFTNTSSPNNTKMQNLHTQPLVFHLVKVFFNRLNCHHPVLSESYFQQLMRTNPDQPASLLLLYSLCLASLNLFSRRHLCIILRQFFSESFYNLLKKCYLSPSLPLFLAYTVMSLLSPYDICHSKLKPQIYFFNQSQILLSVLGIHVKTPHLNLPQHVIRLRNVSSFNTHIGEMLTSNFIFSSYQGSGEKFFDSQNFPFEAHVNKAINPAPSTPVQRISCCNDFSSNHLYFKNLFLLSFSASSLLKDTRKYPEASCLEVEMNNRLLIKFEISLHNVFYGYAINQGHGSLKNQKIQVPIKYIGIQNFVTYLNQLLEFYRPLIHLPTLSTIEPCLKERILVHDFLTWTPEQKMLTVIRLLKQALTIHSLYFIDSNFTFKWWRICSIFLFLISLDSQIKKFNYNHQVSDLVSDCLKVIHKTLELGKERTEIAKFILDNSISMVKDPKIRVAVVSSNYS